MNPPSFRLIVEGEKRARDLLKDKETELHRVRYYFLKKDSIMK